MIKWIFKRTLLTFAILVVSVLLMLTGGGVCIIGMFIPSIWVFIGGIIIGGLGVFLRIFARALTKWVEVKMGGD